MVSTHESGLLFCFKFLIETHSLPILVRCCSHSFTFYVALGIRFILIFAF
jgi:hypothetical protein